MIREFLPKDSKAVYKLGNMVSSNFSVVNNLEDIYLDKYTKILVYVKGRKVIGFLMYIELEFSVDILDIVVLEKYRKQNIASCLLDYMISGLSDSVKLITLEVRASNNAAICLYKKFGFTINGIRKKYYGEEDAYLMGRDFK